ncbi:alcohol oxidase [Mycena pura]|uniref:Alcohol oxidase n=1 Tax=Mycena pura TaxID=153505 RepID=A0AAD6VD50_9AGAR|nr:alcohol oxidase [Mycena pura]
MGLFSRPTFPSISVDQVGTAFDASAKQATETKTYDYIVVGGGTAGCCLASRLSEDPMVSVLVLERGPLHDTMKSNIPLISTDQTSKGTPLVKTPSEPVIAGRGQLIPFIQAEALGGGSSANAMLFTRGAVGDFNRWAELGHTSWDYKSLEPYFIKSEKCLDERTPWHGFSVCTGPMTNQLSYLPFKSQRLVQQAAIAMGYQNVTDFNSPDVPVDACAIINMAVDESARRVSTCTAYLPASLVQARRQRLKVCTKAVAIRIELDEGVAVGVLFNSSDRSIPGTFYARARKEIVLCCGALASPQLLLLSGIGAKEHLSEHGIKCVVDLPGVGSHLQDHVGLPIMYEVPMVDTLHHGVNSIWKGLLEFGKYMLGYKSIFGNTPSPMSIFAHSTHIDDKTAAVPLSSPAEGANRPDIEIMAIAYCASGSIPEKFTTGVFSFLIGVLQPKSLGSVRLASSDPYARPKVDLGFLTNRDDYAVLLKGVKLSMRIADWVTANGYPMKHYDVPRSESESDLDEFIRSKLATLYHYTSTCRMGRPEEGGVVGDDLKVHGVRGLRVCDASVFPCITSAHTMAPVIAVAERCADIMKQADSNV